MSAPQVTTRDDGAVRILMLSRPDRKNAMTPQMLTEALAEVQRCKTDGKALVVAGEGDTFCAGFDMKMVHEQPRVLADLLTGLSTLIRALRRLEAPVVVAAHGAAVAGGCALLGGADVAVTNVDAKLGYPVVKLGVSPAVNGPSLSSAVGFGPARRMMLDPSLISGREAYRIGLAHHCCDTAAEVLPKSLQIAHHLAAWDRANWATTKRDLNDFDGSSNDDAFDKALAASMSLVGSPDQLARVAALWA
ncbi:MAG: enoyl-CoA hydratase/isomerase family protein [Phycisphaerales bacterium]